MRDLTADESDRLKWGVPVPADWWAHAQTFFAADPERADAALADKLAYCDAKIASGATLTRAEEMAVQESTQLAKGATAAVVGAEKAAQRAQLAALLGIPVSDLKL